jgi:DNA-directed RNA polymerase subunit K/omega
MVKNLPNEGEEITDYSRYERARMIGSRALQISMGAPFMIELSEKELEEIHYDPVMIARKEFEAGKLPITVRRPKPKFRESAKR